MYPLCSSQQRQNRLDDLTLLAKQTTSRLRILNRLFQTRIQQPSYLIHQDAHARPRSHPDHAAFTASRFTDRQPASKMIDRDWSAKEQHGKEWDFGRVEQEWLGSNGFVKVGEVTELEVGFREEDRPGVLRVRRI